MEVLEVRKRVSGSFELVLSVSQKPDDIVVLVEPRGTPMPIAIGKSIDIQPTWKRRNQPCVAGRLAAPFDQRLDDLVLLEIVERHRGCATKVLREASMRNA